MTASLLEKILSFLADLIGFSLAFALMFWFQFHSGWIPEKLDPTRSIFEFVSPYFVHLVGWVGLFAFTGLYRKWMIHSRSFHFYCLVRTLVLGVFLLFCMSFGPGILSSVFDSQPVKAIYTPFFKILIIYLSTLIVVVGFLRMIVQSLLRFLLKNGLGIDKMIIVGLDKTGERVMAEVEKTPQIGHRVFGFIDMDGKSKGEEVGGYPVLGGVKDLRRLITKHRITSVTITHETSSHDDILKILSELAEFPVKVFVVPDLYDVVTGPFKTSFVQGLNLKELFPHHMPEWQVALKRFIDLAVATILLIIASPILILSAIAIRLDSDGPIFYSQERVGQYGRIFKVYKFRTMVVDAEANGPQWAKKRDPRITRIGAFLRKTRIDEIPQFLCVFRGDMSMVGPRPERDHFVEQLREEIPLYTRRLIMKPGITGWAQVRHHYDTSIEDVKQKLMYDLFYFENMSLFLDIQILLRTIWVVLTGKGAQ